jgi:hypothetical protein
VDVTTVEVESTNTSALVVLKRTIVVSLLDIDDAESAVEYLVELEPLSFVTEEALDDDSVDVGLVVDKTCA